MFNKPLRQKQSRGFLGLPGSGFRYRIFFSVVVLEKSPCPRGSLRTNLQVLVLVLGLQSLRILQTVRYVWSCDVHKFGYRHCACGYGEECLTY